MTQPIAAFHAHGTSDFVIPHADPIVALEALLLGDPFSAALPAAESHANAARSAATAKVFPAEIPPTAADVIAAWVHLTSNHGPAGFGDRCIALHLRSLTSWPELARLLRSPEVLAEIEAAAAQLAFPEHNLETHAAAGLRASAAARHRYQFAVAGQLADASDHELADAARKLVAADGLLARVAAQRTLREDHAKGELERVQAEQRAAARVIVDQTVARVREAERIAADDRAKAEQSAQQYRRTRADALAERLKLSGLKTLRVGHDAGPSFAVDDLISSARGMSLEMLARYEAALAAVERG